MSLTEVLVAFAILAIVLSTALVLYDDMRRALKRGENMIDQQQVVRVAYDMVRSDLAMAGFNVEPSGEIGRPDEAIEGAFDTAVVLRADFDLDGDGSGPANPETALAGGAFDVVSTGNDEVVVYALGRPGAGLGLGTLEFDADLTETPRDGDVERISVPGVALVQDSPPYTLYRITFDAIGTPVRLPLADHVMALRFRYFDRSGNALNAGFDLADPTDDIGGVDDALSRDRRAAIHRIEVDLVGETRDADAQYRLDATSLSEIPRGSRPAVGDRRRFRLTGDVVADNIGLRGFPDRFVVADAPGPPGAPDAVPGHCEGLYVDWTASPAVEDVEYYRLFWGTSAGQLDQQYSTAAAGTYLDGLQDDTDYFLSVQAVSRRGAPSPLSAETLVTTQEATKPDAPAGLLASSGGLDQVVLDWPQVSTNQDAVVGDPDSPAIRDHAGYDIYRVDSTGADLDATPVLARVDSSTLQFVDESMVRCRDYFYNVRAVDRCDHRSAPSTFRSGRADSTTPPAAPGNAAAYRYVGDSIRVTWQRVNRDVDGDPIAVDTYRIERSVLKAINVAPDDADFSALTELTFSPGQPGEYIDPSVVLPPGQTIHYRVKAVDGCGNVSAPSRPVHPDCYLVGDLVIVNPADGALLSASTTVVVQVTPLTGPWEKLLLIFEGLDSGTVTSFDLGTNALNRWTFDDWTWVEDIEPHRLTATLVRAEDCEMSRSIEVAPDPELVDD